MAFRWSLCYTGSYLSVKQKRRLLHERQGRIYRDLPGEHPAGRGGRLLDYLEHKSDFFTAPASARFHGAYAGGLCEHSVNVYHCLTAYLERERVKELYGLEYPAESVALVSLLTTCARRAATGRAPAT